MWQHFSASFQPDSVSTPRPRLCVLKREAGEAFGFNLRVERGCNGHVIRNVVSGGIAERSGLRDGDRLLEVNNYYIDDVPHPEVRWASSLLDRFFFFSFLNNSPFSLIQVARKIKLSGHQLCLLVLDGEEYEQTVSQGQDLQTLVKAHKEEGCKPPRLCYITKDSASGLGISFTPLEGKACPGSCCKSIVQDNILYLSCWSEPCYSTSVWSTGEKGQFSVSLVKGGAAEKAGVCKGDHLVWMNGAMVSHLTHAALSRMVCIIVIKKSFVWSDANQIIKNAKAKALKGPYYYLGVVVLF